MQSTLEIVVGLLFLVGWGAVTLWPGVIGPYLARASSERAKRTFDDADRERDVDDCWQCQRQGLRWLEPEVFQCPACRNLQGSGAAAYIARRRRDELAKLPVQEQRARMNKMLRDIELPLVGVRGDMEMILRVWAEHERSRGDDEDHHESPTRRHERTEMRSLFETCSAEVQRIEARLGDVIVLSASPMRITVFDGSLLHQHWHRAWDEGDVPRDLLTCQKHIDDLQNVHRTLHAALADMSKPSVEVTPSSGARPSRDEL